MRNDAQGRWAYPNYPMDEIKPDGGVVQLWQWLYTGFIRAGDIIGKAFGQGQFIYIGGRYQ